MLILQKYVEREGVKIGSKIGIYDLWLEIYELFLLWIAVFKKEEEQRRPR